MCHLDPSPRTGLLPGCRDSSSVRLCPSSVEQLPRQPHPFWQSLQPVTEYRGSSYTWSETAAGHHPLLIDRFLSVHRVSGAWSCFLLLAFWSADFCKHIKFSNSCLVSLLSGRLNLWSWARGWGSVCQVQTVLGPCFRGRWVITEMAPRLPEVSELQKPIKGQCAGLREAETGGSQVKPSLGNVWTLWDPIFRERQMRIFTLQILLIPIASCARLYHFPAKAFCLLIPLPHSGLIFLESVHDQVISLPQTTQRPSAKLKIRATYLRSGPGLAP